LSFKTVHLIAEILWYTKIRLVLLIGSIYRHFTFVGNGYLFCLLLLLLKERSPMPLNCEVASFNLGHSVCVREVFQTIPECGTVEEVCGA